MRRPRKLTPKVQAAICDAIRKGVPREQAARLANIGPSTLRLWLQTAATEESGPHRSLLDAVERAEDELLQEATCVIHKSLQSDDPKIALAAAKFVLERRDAANWSQRKELRIEGKDGGPVRAELSGPGGSPLPVSVKVERSLFSDTQLRSMSPEQLSTEVAMMVRLADAGVPLKAERLFTREQLSSLSVAHLEAIGRALGSQADA